jgi:hypothetical protein
MTTVADIFGANPYNMKWTVVRGDTAVLRVEFLQDDEVTAYSTSTWEYASYAYDFRGDVLDELETFAGNGYVEITAPAETTKFWGIGYKAVVAELAFDLQVTIDDTVWTPVIGTITVVGDVTGGSL